MLLSKNERFIQEHAEFSLKIKNISNEQVQNECWVLLKELTRHVQEIDKRHYEFASSRMPDQLSSVRESIQSVRKKLNSRLKDC